MAEIKILAEETIKSWLEVHERKWFMAGEKVFLFEHTYGSLLYEGGYEEYWIPHRYRLSHLCTNREDVIIEWRIDYDIIANIEIHEFRNEVNEDINLVSEFIKENFGIYMPTSPDEGRRVKEW